MNEESQHVGCEEWFINVKEMNYHSKMCNFYEFLLILFSFHGKYHYIVDVSNVVCTKAPGLVSLLWITLSWGTSSCLFFETSSSTSETLSLPSTHQQQVDLMNRGIVTMDKYKLLVLLFWTSTWVIYINFVFTPRLQKRMKKDKKQWVYFWTSKMVRSVPLGVRNYVFGIGSHVYYNLWRVMTYRIMINPFHPSFCKRCFEMSIISERLSWAWE